MAACKGCGAQVLWKRTTKGRMMPVDPNPNDEGTIMFDALGLAYVAPPNERRKGKTFMAHFITCPVARDHRARR